MARRTSSRDSETGDRRSHDDLVLGAVGGEEVVVLPWPLLIRRRLAERAAASDRYRWFVLATALLGLLSVNFSFTIFAVALPRIAREFGTTENTMTWVITGPMLAYGVFAPTLGKVGDIWGHKRVYLAGMVAAMVMTALAAIAWSASSLIAFRTLGAVEGAATGAASMALIFRVFERQDRVKAMGWWSLVGAGGPVLGLALGGPIVEHFGWRWIFAGQVPVGIAAILLAAAVLPPDTGIVVRQRLDWGGALTLTVGVLGLLIGLNRGPEWGWSHPAVVASFAVVLPALAAFVAVERRVESPLLPMQYLRRRNFAFPIASQVGSNFAYMGGFILAPSFLSRLYGYGESAIGLLVIARPLTFSIVSPLAGYLAVKAGERTAAVAGTAALTVSMVTFAYATDSGIPLVVAALVLSGAGLGMASPSISASVANAVDEADLGIASAAQQLLTQIGIVAGIQLMKTVQAGREATGLDLSFRDAYLVGAAFALTGVVAACFVRSSDRTLDHP